MPSLSVTASTPGLAPQLPRDVQPLPLLARKRLLLEGCSCGMLACLVRNVSMLVLVPVGSCSALPESLVRRTLQLANLAKLLEDGFYMSADCLSVGLIHMVLA